MPTIKSPSKKSKSPESNKTLKSKSPKSNKTLKSKSPSKTTSLETNDYIDSLTRKEKNAITNYQSGSSEINGFLREGYSYLGNKTQKEIHDILEKIHVLDCIFNKTNCPRTTKDTILYRGTPKLYDGLNNAYTSCSKSIDALLEMQFYRRDTILSFYDKCCINILKLDEDIPYLDLENYSDKWKYQREVMLPRGLIAIPEKEEIIEYKHKAITYKFKTYTMRITKTQRPELPLDDRIAKNEIKSQNKFLLDTQRTEIIKLSNMFTPDSDYTDEKDEIYELVEYLYDWSEKGITTRSQYKKISDKIVSKLRKNLPLMKTSPIVKESCKKNIDDILQTVNSITDADILTNEKYIIVPDC